MEPGGGSLRGRVGDQVPRGGGSWNTRGRAPEMREAVQGKSSRNQRRAFLESLLSARLSKEQLGGFTQNCFQSSRKTGRCSSSGHEEGRILHKHLHHLVETPERSHLVMGLSYAWSKGFSFNSQSIFLTISSNYTALCTDGVYTKL